MTTDTHSPRNAFISGGSSGINLGIAEQFAKAGMRLAIQGRNQEKLDSAAAHLNSLGGQAISFSADVRDEAATRQAIEDTAKSFGKLDVVIAGAAGNFVSPAAQMSGKGFEAVIDIDLKGTFNVLRAAHDFAADNASFIAISAPQSVVPYPMQAHVNAAKAGIDQLIRTLAVEWGPRGIRVNAISPGPIEGTEGMKRLTPTPEMAQKMASVLPMQRFGTPEDIANLAAFLCSDGASYITGTCIACDGGTALMGAALFGAST